MLRLNNFQSFVQGCGIFCVCWCKRAGGALVGANEAVLGGLGTGRGARELASLRHLPDMTISSNQPVCGWKTLFHFNSSRFNSISFNPIQSNSTQFNSILFNSTQVRHLLRRPRLPRPRELRLREGPPVTENTGFISWPRCRVSNLHHSLASIMEFLVAWRLLAESPPVTVTIGFPVGVCL